MGNRTWRVVACAAGLVLGASTVGPASAQTPGSPEVDGLPSVLHRELSATEKSTLAARTSGEGVPLAAFVRTPDGPEITALDAGSRADAAAAAALLEAQPSVDAADVSTMTRATGSTFAEYLYGNTMIGSEIARSGVDNPLSDVVVAVLDTGVWPHPELAGALIPGRNFTDSPGGVLDTTDRAGHGTHVAGTIAADAASDMEGVAHGVRILPVKVLGDGGLGHDYWAADGIIWAADNGADVINMSLGGPGHSSLEESAVAYARSRGVTVVAAAGNEDSSAFYSPAGLPGVIAVSAVDETKARAPFSNHGPSIDVAAPGVDIWSTTNDDWFDFMSGTSMASPHVAGVAALVEGAAPGLTPGQVEQALTASATDLGSAGRDDLFGHGLVDAPAAVEAANSLETTGALPPAEEVTPPGAPTVGSVTPRAGSAVVRWAAPVSDGGSPVTRYTVRAYRGSSLVKTVQAVASARGVTVTGLANGAPYTFFVSAINAVGEGSTSARSAVAVPHTIPSAPRITGVRAGRSAAAVTWTRPYNGGASIRSYTVRVYRGASLIRQIRVSAATTGLTVTRLQPLVGHSFRVFAANAAGTGYISASSARVVPLR